MRTAILLAIVILTVTVILAVQRLSAGGVDHQLIALIAIMLPGVAPYLYGAHLADRNHTDNPEKFSKFTGSSNLPIVQALFRASQGGDRLAMWSLIVMFSAPFLFALVLIAPAISRRFLN